MNNLKKLLTSIDDFYKKAMRSYSLMRRAAGWQDIPEVSEDYEEESGTNTPEDYEEEVEANSPPYFEDLLDVAHVVEPGLGFQLGILAELYKRALKIGGGYATIAKGIRAVKDLYGDELDSNSEAVLNSIMIELAKHAGGAAALAGRDNPAFVQQLAQLKLDIEERGKEEQNEREAEYQRDVNVPGALPEGQQMIGGRDEDVDKPEEEKPEDVYDAPGGGKDGPQVNPGRSTFTKKEPRDMVKQYANAATVCEIEMAGEQDPKRISNLKSLAILLRQVSALEEQAINLYDTEISPRGDEALPEHKEKLAQYHKEIAELLKKKVYPLNRKIYESRLAKIIQDLESKKEDARDPNVKGFYDQRIALHKLSLSKDVGKTPERNARLELIRMMSEQGNMPGKDILNRQLEKINQAAAKKVPFEIYDKKRQKKYTEQRIENKLSGEITGFVIQLSEKYSTFLSENKKLKENAYHNEPAIVRYASAYKAALKATMINPSQEAEQKRDVTAAALAEAIENYKQRLAKVAEVKELLQVLTNYTSGRYSKPRSPWFWADEIPEDKKALIQEVMIRAQSVNTEFERVMPWTETVNQIVQKLKEKISPRTRIFTDLPETRISIDAPRARVESPTQEGEFEGSDIDEELAKKQMRLTQGHMNKKHRKTILDRLTKEAQTISDAEIDAKAEEQTKKLFMELWDNSPTRLEGES